MSSAEPELEDAAARLAGATVLALEPAAIGGNNRVFRLRTAGGTFALKRYLRTPEDRRDRLGAEFAGLAYAAAVAPGRVPVPVAADPHAGIALYEWIVGVPPREHGADEIAQAVALVRALHEGRERAEAGLPSASEAILEPRQLASQVESRIERLGALREEPELAAFLGERLIPAYERYRPALGALDPPEPQALTLSPSDFGFHNALRREGRLVFLDFEYFGWDDPVKLVCDFLWHPGMALSEAERGQFLSAMTDVFREGTSFVTRLRAYEPLIALRWAAIVLGEFLPEVWERRKYAGRGALDRDDAKRAQLAKAHAILDRLRREDRTRC